MAIKITKGKKNDSSVAADLSEGLTGSLYGDKDISKKLFAELFESGLRIFTGIRKDIKKTI